MVGFFSGPALVFLLGWTNLIGLALVLVTCRCTPVRLPKKITQTRAYQKFYSKHCYIWWFFLASVAFHALFAITYYGSAL